MRRTVIREWSLIKGSWAGGATKREGGGHVKFFPYKKGGAQKGFEMGDPAF